jgi:hypothetical protein
VRHQAATVTAQDFERIPKHLLVLIVLNWRWCMRGAGLEPAYVQSCIVKLWEIEPSLSKKLIDESRYAAS